MADIAEASQKKLKTRISKFRKCNKDEQEKEKFFNKLGISFTINVPDENSENEKMINIYSNPDGNITYSEYIYPDEEKLLEFRSVMLRQLLRLRVLREGQETAV